MRLTAGAQITALNIDFETGTNSNWTYYRGTNTNVGTTAVWSLTTCAPAPTLHDIVNSSMSTDYYGGFPVVGDGLYSLKLGKDSANENADGASYNIHVPTSGTFCVMYKYALVVEDPGHLSYQQPRFEVNVTDSATGLASPCNSFGLITLGSSSGWTHSAFGGDVYYTGWSTRTIDLSGMGGKTLTVTFKVGGCTLGGHWGYAYVDMSTGLFAISKTACSGGHATLTGPYGDSLYKWTDSLTYTASYGTTQTIVITTPTVATTYAVILTPYAGFGCTDTAYTRVIPSNLITHQSHDTSICFGASVRMWGGATDILPLTYSWTPPTGLSCTTCDSTWVTPPVGVNSYKITTMNSGGCIETDTIKVTVYPLATSILGNKNVCLGQTRVLSDAVTGGSWSSSSTAISITSGSGVVTGLALGTAVVTYSFAGMCPVFTTVTVQPLPTAIAGSGVVCVGFNTSLTDASGAGTWTSSNTAIATVGTTSGIVTGMSPGTATITYFNNATTCYSTKTMTVVPLPSAITGSTTICQYATTTLTDPGGGTWSSSNTVVASIGSSSGIVTGLTPGTSVISYSISPGCYVTTIMTILLTPTPITGTPAVCAGGTTSLSDALGGGVWASSDLTVATVGIGGLVTGVAPVTCLISYSFPTGCRTTITVTVTAAPTSISGTTSVCIGLTTNLTDATPGGSWSSSNTNCGVGSSSGVVTGLVAGTSVITYKMPGGCYVTTTVTTTSGPSPITGVKTVCSGQTTCLTDATPGGTWSSSTLAVASVASSGCVTGVSAGSATITYALSSGCPAVTVVTVYPSPTAILGTLKACVGLSTTLSDAASGGVWSSSLTTTATVGSSSGVVSALIAGTTTISYTLSTGCNATIVFTVNPLPVTISGATGVCSGSTTKLTDGTGGGVWSSSSTSVATVSTTGLVSGVSTGTATISYTLVLTGCYTTTVVTVGIVGSPISGTTSICLGATTTLSDATTGGTWTSGNTAIATIGATSGLLTGISAGTTSITYSLGGGCVTTTTVTILPIPVAIAGSVSICAGATATLSDATPGGTWSSSDITVATIGATTGIVTGVAAGTATITYSLGMGCGDVYTIATIYPMPSAISGTTTVYVGSTTGLSDAFPGGTWSSDDITVAPIGSLTGVVLGVLPGTATITYSVGSGCPDVYITVTVIPLPLTVHNVSNRNIGEVSIYPNPTAGLLNIQWRNQIKGNADVIITDVVGRKMYRSTMNINTENGEKQIDLGYLMDGVYLIGIKSDQINYSRKLLLER